MSYIAHRIGMVLPSPPQVAANGNKGSRWVKAKAMKRAMATATRVASKDEVDGNGNKGGGQVTATRAMVVAVAMTVVAKDDGKGDGNEGGGPQRG